MKAKEYRKKIKDLVLEENLLLPDFQRDFVWKPQEQQSRLVSSLFLEIPIGSILVLDALDDVGLRKLCYKDEKEEVEQSQAKLLMDGQQRISTIKVIFSDLYSSSPDEWKDVHDCLHHNLKYRWFLNLSLKDSEGENLKGEELKKKLKLLYDFYWNKKFEKYDIDDIEFFTVSKKILVKNQKERWHPSQSIDVIKNYCTENDLLPLFLILSDLSNLKPIIENISTSYIKFLREEKDKDFVEEHIESIERELKIENLFQNKELELKVENKIKDKIVTNVMDFFNDYIIYKEIYGVEYEKTQLEKAIVAFNTMNTGGISLGVFDIISAKYSKLKKGRLSKKLYEYAKSFIETKDQIVTEIIEEKFINDDKNLITKNFSDMYLNMLSIFINESTEDKKFKLDHIKQKSLLTITAEDIENNSEKAIESLILAFQFLIERCGVPSIKDIKYKLIIIPIAYNLYKNKNKNKVIENKIEYSYWMSLFSGKYEKGQNASSIDHLNHLIEFISHSTNNHFLKYKDDLCSKRGYSDFEGFRSFYEDSSHTYSSNIGEYFLQFILSCSCKSGVDIFKHSQEKGIEIEHFKSLHKDHIIPSSWMKGKNNEGNRPIDSVLNKFYSPSKRNLERLNSSIEDEIEKKGMEVLCIPTKWKYRKEEFNSEDEIKDFLEKRFEFFKKQVKKHLEELKTWDK